MRLKVVLGGSIIQQVTLELIERFLREDCGMGMK